MILAASKYAGGGGTVVLGVAVQYAAYRYYRWRAEREQRER